jgi:hypothetical protein
MGNSRHTIFTAAFMSERSRSCDRRKDELIVCNIRDDGGSGQPDLLCRYQSMHRHICIVDRFSMSPVHFQAPRKGSTCAFRDIAALAVPGKRPRRS